MSNVLKLAERIESWNYPEGRSLIEDRTADGRSLMEVMTETTRWATEFATLGRETPNVSERLLAAAKSNIERVMFVPNHKWADSCSVQIINDEALLIVESVAGQIANHVASVSPTQAETLAHVRRELQELSDFIASSQLSDEMKQHLMRIFHLAFESIDDFNVYGMDNLRSRLADVVMTSRLVCSSKMDSDEAAEAAKKTARVFEAVKNLFWPAFPVGVASGITAEQVMNSIGM